MKQYKLAYAVLMGIFALHSSTASASGPHYTGWSAAVPESDTNNSVAGGCPIESRDGLTIVELELLQKGEVVPLGFFQAGEDAPHGRHFDGVWRDVFPADFLESLK